MSTEKILVVARRRVNKETSKKETILVCFQVAAGDEVHPLIFSWTRNGAIEMTEKEVLAETYPTSSLSKEVEQLGKMLAISYSSLGRSVSIHHFSISTFRDFCKALTNAQRVYYCCSEYNKVY